MITTPLDPDRRVHEIARELGVKSQDIRLACRALGYAPPSASTALPPVFAALVIAHYNELHAISA